MRRLLFLLTAALLAQDVTFKVESNLVIVNVAVRDRNGAPITNLKKEDFVVLEDGVPQSLAVFELEKLNSDLLTPVSFTANSPRTIEEKVPEVAAGTSVTKPTAAAPTRHQDKRLMALFFDFSSMPQPDQVRARDSAVKFLSSQMTASDMVSIMTFGNRLQVVEDFTDDRDRLLDTLHKMALGEASELAATAATSAEEGDDSGAFTADDTEFNIFNTDRKLSAIEDAAKKLSVYPEKKALIYFSSGVSKTGVENQSQLKSTVNAAVRANVSIYSVDARGLVATPPGGDASTASPRGTGVFSGTKQQSQRDSFNDSQETLTSLSSDTGGKALLDSNDLTMGIRQAQTDINSYYILGYYPSNSALDGKYRKIQVKLATPQLQAKLDYRAGYYAAKTFQKFTAGDKERQLEEALTLGDPVSELPLALEVDYFRVARDRYFVPISVKIPGSVLALAKKGGKQTTDLDFIGQVRDASGKLVGGVRDNITVKLTDANAERLGNRNLQYDAGLTLGPGQYSLRFLARENQSGKMGTFETKFTVPDLNAGRNLRLSSVILSSQKEPVAAAVGSAGDNKRLLAGHPLVDNGQKTVPSITRVFRKDQTLYVYFEVYDPALPNASGEGARTPSLTAEIDLLQGARKAFSSPPVRVNKLATTRPGVAPFSFQIPLARIAGGQYVAQVNVIDENGRHFAFPRNSMVVLP
ncbi:MAG TPA: VWA domain-containing protein [Bryobacteraceae bacterium]|nr:VWA domain-containing protein [Bryobacteraceae bacterium]